MGLVYKRSTKNAARRYERSSGMEPNPGVNALTVVNPGRPPRRNPFQWIEGRGQRHIHESRAYEQFDTAKRWKGRSKHPGAKLYPVDERGTIVSRPVPASLLKNRPRRNEMAYNIGALRRAMRANMSPEDREAIKAAASAIHTGKLKPRKTRTRRTGGTTETVSAAGATIASTGRKGKKGRKTGSRKASRRKTTGRKASGRKTSARKASRRKTSRKSAGRKSAGRKSRGRKQKRGGTRRAAGRKTSGRKSSRRRSSRRGGSRRASKRKWGRFFRRQSLRLTGREYVDKYLRRGVLPAVTRLGRSSYHRSGRPYVMTYPIPGGAYGRTSKRRMSGRRGSRHGYAVGATYRGRRKRRMPALAANRRRRTRRNSRRASVRRNSRRSSRRRSSRRASARRSSRRRASRRRSTRNPHYVLVNPRRRRRSRRGSRRRGSRRSSRGLYANRRRSTRRNSRRRRSRRRNSRRSSMSLYANRRHSRRRSTRRNSRRRRSLRRNMLAVSKVRWSGSGRSRMGKALGRSYQLVEFGRGSKKYRRAGYPVMVPPHVSMHGYVRKFRFGGAALDAHKRAVSSGYRERKRYMKSRRLGKNKRRTSMRRNPKYVVMNRHGRRRRVRRNFLGTLGRIDWMNDVVTPVAAGTAGFVAARVLSNSLANVGALRNALDAGAAPADARNTKLAANAVGIVATLGLATAVPMVRRYQGALVTGMGLALADRLIQRFGGDYAAGYLSGFGEYVNQPMGEYVNQPMGEYVNQPMSGLGTMYATAGLGTMYAAAGYPEGIDPSDQDGTDGLMDTMEAAAGVGAFEAAAGMGATMGGGEADAKLASMYAKMQPPFTSIQTPTDLAREVSREFPYDKTVPTSLTTPEGKGYAGGLFSRHLFAGMMGS